MKKITFKNASYIKSALESKDYPHFRQSSGQLLPEIAVLGRSNVGKSSLLNDLFQTHNLVKTSSTPGKTRSLNFFNVDQKLIFVDLPGYGYAKTSLNFKKMWADTLQDYLLNREALKLFLLLLDIRHMPSVEDVQMYRWLDASNMPFLIVFTKVDKLTSIETKSQTEEAMRLLNASHVPFVCYSVPKRVGREDLVRLIMEGIGNGAT